MLNQCIIVGRIVNEPELKKLDDDKKVCNMTIAVPRTYKNKDGKYDYDFIDCSIWDGVADNTVNYCQKGDLIGIKGHIQTKVVETEKGNQKEHYLVAEKVSFLSSSIDKTKEDGLEV